MSLPALSADERREKFFACAGGAALPLERSRVEEAFSGLERIEEQDDLRPLIQSLAASSVIV